MAESQEPPIWVDELVARNEELLKAVAENQALGRLADAVAYQELFQQNVLKLATFCDLSNEVLDSGDATLGGKLRVRAVNGFIPAVGDRFIILTCDGAIAGAFDLVAVADLPAGFTVDVFYDTNSVEIEVVDTGRSVKLGP